MDDKIKKSASKLQDLVNHYNNPNEVFNDVRTIAVSQRDYFNYLGPYVMIKLTLYIYSLKKTGNFTLGEKMINNLTFSNLLTTNNELSIKECKSCEGSGEITCQRCEGHMTIECPKCEGSGESDDNDDDENYNCEKCRGDGEISCPSCNRGEEICPKCEGSGEIESEDEVSYITYFIVTWNKQIKNLLELRVKTLEPVMSENQFFKLKDEFIVLSELESSAPLDVLENEMYCINYSDNPQLYLQGNMSIRSINRHLDAININHLYH